VRALQPRLGSGDDRAALGARAELGRAAALRATTTGQFAVELGGGDGGKVGQKITTYTTSTSTQPITANTASIPR
jgi:hypothetical protein